MNTLNQESPKALAVVIPMYNESAVAERCVRAVCLAIDQLDPNIGFFVVNDGSSDDTQAILLSLQKDPKLPLIVVEQKPNQGYGAACLAGANRAFEGGYKFGLFMDSDLTNDPKYIAEFLRLVQTDQYDVIKASRYVPQGGMSGVPAHRQWISRTGNWVASLLFNVGIKDCTNGFRAVRLNLLPGLKFNERGFAVILEELYYLKKFGARMTEFPNILTSRSSEIATSKFNYTFKTFYNYFKYAFKASFVRGKAQ